jgi:hypothetical protein
MNVELPYNEEWLITHYNTTVSTAISSSEYRADECYQVVEDCRKRDRQGGENTYNFIIPYYLVSYYLSVFSSKR